MHKQVKLLNSHMHNYLMEDSCSREQFSYICSNEKYSITHKVYSLLLPCLVQNLSMCLLFWYNVHDLWRKCAYIQQQSLFQLYSFLVLSMILIEQKAFSHRYVKPEGSRAVITLAPTSSCSFLPCLQNSVTHISLNISWNCSVTVISVSCCWMKVKHKFLHFL